MPPDAARMRRRWMDQTIPNIFGAVSVAVTNMTRCSGFVGDITEVRIEAFGEERILGRLAAVFARHNVAARRQGEDYTW